MAVLLEERCSPEKCNAECWAFCPPVRNGIECIILDDSSGKPIVSEPLCIGCGICVNKCPHDALIITQLPSELEEDRIHRYGQNGFRLFRLPTPSKDQVVGILGPNGMGKSTAINILSGKIIPNLGEYGNRFGLTDQRAQRLQESAVVMHPGPMNRGVEMHVDPADLPNSLIHKQVANGVSVRMAVLFDVLARGGELNSLKEEGVA